MVNSSAAPSDRRPRAVRGNEAAYRRVGMTVERPKINRIDRPASRAANPQKPKSER